MGKLLNHTTTQAHLFEAWRQIRQNGYASSQEETRWATEQFDRQANHYIRKIQRLIRQRAFEFDPQIGVTKAKKSGNGKRGIVMASIHNRIVERALLDTLQSNVPFVKSVINMPTSVGGVPERSVPHGLKLIVEATKSGCQYFVRSDISGFFDGIPRKAVLEQLGFEAEDELFLALLDRATSVVLANETALGDDRKIFPTDEQGVAQGSPLSPIFGNMLLHDFDLQFNKDGIICVRFIDDFVLLSKDEWRVKKAFESAKAHLNRLGLKCHDPFLNARKDKAECGHVDAGFVFLGYDIRPGQLQPAAAARTNVIKAVKDRIKSGKRDILNLKREPHSDNTQRYSQTMVGIDRVLRGWGNAFAYGNAPATINDLDLKIDKELASFRSWYGSLIKDLDWKARRRTGGVCLLSDIKIKDIADVPFRLEQGKRFIRSSNTVKITTDGSVAGDRRRGKDRGLGGWGFVIHEPYQEGSGSANDVTNNQMELMAVIEAIKSSPKAKSICIRTDSQYVLQIAQGVNLAKSNSDLWREYQRLAADKKINIIWIKGHAGDPHNERADALAKARSSEAA